MFLGAIVSTAASRYENDQELPALTDQANDHHQIIYDADNGINASFACTVSYTSSMLEVLNLKSKNATGDIGQQSLEHRRGPNPFKPSSIRGQLSRRTCRFTLFILFKWYSSEDSERRNQRI